MLKKHVKKLLFLIAIVVTLIISIPTIKTLAEQNNRAINVNNNYQDGVIKNSNTINILEIQPGNSFTLMPEKSSGIHKYDDSVVVHHMSMPEFIGNISELNGMYDVIIIGNNINGGTYSQINYDKPEKNANTMYWGDLSKEYNENDITKRKVDEIIKFINSGQLVYINNSILTNRNISESNLVTKFNAISNINFIKYLDENSLKINDDIKNKVNNNIYKRFKINVDVTGGEKLEDINITNGSIENRNLNFKVSPPVVSDIGEVDINLYLDINGDGLFKEKEIYKTISLDNFDKLVDIQYQIDYEFIGLLDWKIEVVKKNSGTNKEKIKSYETGNLYFKPLSKDKKKSIRVLQILPKDTNLNLKTNKKFQEIINSQKDYNIEITTISYNEYNTKVKDKSLSLNGNYDMVILGFQDEYGKEVGYFGSEKTKFEQVAIDELKKFISSGQSVMFTHDSMPGYTNSNLMSNFRNYIGQARFLPVGTITTTDPTLNPNGYSYVEDLYKEYNIKSGKYETRYIPNLNNNKEIKGYSFWSRKTSPRQKVVYETNKGLITNYPFDITSNSKKFIEVASTHHQYFQLNLEDEDVVPWYNLTDFKDLNGSNVDGSGVNKYDSRNFYYTYSKGNITYSGTGHSNGYTDDEFKLFVNTIVKAERGANHAPTLDSNVVINPGEYDLKIPFKSDFKFIVIPKDIDNDNVKITVKAYMETKEKTTEIGDYGFVKQGTTQDIIISNKMWEGNSGHIICVEVEVEDIRGAKYTQTYRFKPTSDPTITINTVEGKGLVGEEINVKLNIIKNDEQGKNEILDDYNFLIKEYDESIFEEVKIEKNSNNYILKVKTKAEINSFIPINLKYKVGKKDELSEKNIDFKVPISSKNPNIEVKIVDVYKELDDKIPSIKLIKNNSDEDIKSGENLIWNNTNTSWLSTSEYSINFSKVGGNYKVKESNIKRNKNESGNDYNLGNNFEISYDNPEAYIEILLEKKVRDISHGLYNSIIGDNLNLIEGTVNLVRESTATGAIGFKVNSDKVIFGFEFDSQLTNKEILGLYKIENGVISVIGGKEIFKKVDKEVDKYEVELPSGINSESKIVILYKCRVPKIGESNNTEFINKVFINDEEIKEKQFKIKTTTTNKNNIEEEIQLPDLF